MPRPTLSITPRPTRVRFVRFIEDNWLDGARIQGSFDAIARSLDNMFNYSTNTPNVANFLLSENSGEPLNPAQAAGRANALRKFDRNSLKSKRWASIPER